MRQLVWVTGQKPDSIKRRPRMTHVVLEASTDHITTLCGRDLTPVNALMSVEPSALADCGHCRRREESDQ